MRLRKSKTAVVLPVLLAAAGCATVSNESGPAPDSAPTVKTEQPAKTEHSRPMLIGKPPHEKARPIKPSGSDTPAKKKKDAKQADLSVPKSDGKPAAPVDPALPPAPSKPPSIGGSGG